MGLLLDLGYSAAGLLAAPWLMWKSASDTSYRSGLGERLGAIPKRQGKDRCLWVHGASVGEINVVRALLTALREQNKDLVLHVSALTPAGRENARRVIPNACVHYWPLDLSWCVRRALRRVRPDLIMLAELELWPNFMQAAEVHQIPLIVVNGRLSERSFRRYRRFGWVWRPIFRSVARWAVQSTTVAERLLQLGVASERITVTGNLKYDAALAFDPAAACTEMKTVLGLDAEESVLVAGSTHEPEEKIVIETFLKLQAVHPRLRLVIAPRHLERVPEIERLIESVGLPCARRSRGVPPKGRVVLLDSLGELAKVYSVATVVFIGGTYSPRGGQNMLEPAALGKPIVSGPSLSNFQEIAEALRREGGMRIVEDPRDLANALGEFLTRPDRACHAGEAAKRVVQAGRGALATTTDLAETLLPNRTR